MVFLRNITIILLISFNIITAFDFSPVRLKYSGGDWYNDENCLKILAQYVNKNTDIKMDTNQIVLSMDSKKIFDYPFLFMTGHGGLKYTQKEIINIRKYLLNGGFLYIDDDYGFNKDIMNFMEDLFPDRDLVRIPNDFEIYRTFYKFDYMPKIHEHYKGSPEVYGIFINKKLSLLYTFNTNISDGWAVYETHKDPKEKRIQALKMGVNIVYYALFK